MTKSADSKIAYIMSRFPGLSETFILREMCELERLGWKLELYPLIYQEEEVIHDEAKTWMVRVKRPALKDIVFANIRLFFARPWLYLVILFRVFWGNVASPKFISRAAVVFPTAVWMARQMANEKIAHVHAHYATHPALAAWIINQITGITYSVTVHAHDIFVDKSMLRPKLENAKAIICISQFNRAYLMNYLGDWVGDKIAVIHCGIEPELYLPRAYHVLPGQSTFRVVSIGSLRTYKGFTYLLDACAVLRNRGMVFKCTIIGGGELRDELQSKIQKLDLRDYVDLAGPKRQNEVAEFLKLADCYVQPSIITKTGKMEGIPVALMEAMASGLPVVATNISGIPELVKPNETGYLVQPEDPAAMVEAILSIYENPNRAIQYAQHGRELVHREFNLATNVNLLSQKFESLIEDILWK